MEYRILGLAAEAAFFTLLSVPPLLLSMIGLLGYVDAWTGADTIASLESNILDASRTVLTQKGVHQIAEPILHDVMKGGRPDIISSASCSPCGRARARSTSSSTPSP